MKKILLIFTLLITLSGCMKEVTVKATIISHTILTDNYGSANYITVVNTEDGYTEELRGLKYYGLPIGKTFYIKVHRPEK